MAVLFVSMRTDWPRMPPGHVVSVAPDGTIPSAHEERMMLVVSCAALPEATAGGFRIFDVVARIAEAGS